MDDNEDEMEKWRLNPDACPRCGAPQGFSAKEDFCTANCGWRYVYP